MLEMGAADQLADAVQTRLARGAPRPRVSPYDLAAVARWVRKVRRSVLRRPGHLYDLSARRAP